MAKTWEVDFLQSRKPIEAEFKGSVVYKLPIASPEELGGVKPVAKTEDMVQPVGVDTEGALWVKESSLRPDWNQTDEEAGDFIKNKPSLDYVSYSESQDLTDEQRSRARENVAEFQFNWHEMKLGSVTRFVADYDVNGPSFDMDACSKVASVVYPPVSTICAMAIYGDMAPSLVTVPNILQCIKFVFLDYDELYSAGLVTDGIYICTKSRKYGEPECVFFVTKTSTYNSTHCITYREGTRTGHIYYNINTGEYVFGLNTSGCIADASLSKLSWPADAKAVGDALAQKLDATDIATDEEILEMLIQEDMFMAVTDSEGAFLSDESGNILLW